MIQKNNLSETAYQYGCVGMEEVFDNINEYIIPENQEVCRLLWSKNIFTKMCNNYDNDNSWITLGDLSEENDKIFKKLSLSNEYVGKTWLGRGFMIPYSYKESKLVFEEFAKLINNFVMQDVQKEGYLTEEEFLIFYTDCFKIVAGERILDKNKMTKDMEEYLKNSEFANYYDQEEHKIFYNEFYYQRHMLFKCK